MSKRNNHLQRQIWKYYGDKPFPKELEKLIQSVSDSYDNYEKEHKLLNRIMDLSSQELFDANAELRKRNDELDRFVYSTSHDLRAPLTSILGLLQLIELSKDSEDIDKYLGQIRTTTLQLDNFIQDIVNYTHNKKLDITYGEIDFKKLIEDCLDKLNFMSNSESIEKVIEIDGPVAFHSDIQRLNTLISNLISNSIKYCKPDSKDSFLKVRVTISPKEAVITIEDNGIGIDKVHIDKIYDMFYRASAKSKGSGIGLYIVKEIVEKLKGSISMSSELNMGTTFTLVLPNQGQFKTAGKQQEK